jgi:HD superfamily phosphodiesterase
MQRRDQRHALEVMGRLQALEVKDRDLLAAALLHDCGKGEVPVWLRIANVLSPALLRRMASAQAGGWRGHAHRLVDHAEIGARVAAAAGASEATVRYISGRVEAYEESLLALLIAADDAS